MKNCLVEEDYNRPIVYDTDRMMCEAMGIPVESKCHVRYIHKGDEYLAISAGFAWPEGSNPGMVVVVGVKDGDEHTYKILDEYEHNRTPKLLNKAWSFWQAYGQNCTTIPYLMYGDYYDPRDESLSAFRVSIPEAKDNLFLVLPPYWGDRDFEKLYGQVLADVLPITDMNDTPKLKSRMLAVDPMRALTDKQVMRISPAWAATAFVLCALETNKPWIWTENQKVSDEPYVDQIEKAMR